MRILAIDGTIGETFGTLGVELLSSIPTLQIDWFDLRRIRENRYGFRQTATMALRVMRGEYDLIVVGKILHGRYFSKISPFIEFLYHISRCFKYPNAYGVNVMLWALKETPLVVIDRWDEPTIDRWNHRLLERCRLYFKRELPLNRFNTFLHTMDNAVFYHQTTLQCSPFYALAEGKLRPISLGLDVIPEAHLLDRPKEVDLFFAGRIRGYPIREMGEPWLQQLREEGVRVEVAEQPLSREQFFERCASAYLVWSPSGYGWDCWRHYEAAAAGSVPVMNHPDILQYRPLREGVHALYYGAGGDSLCMVVKRALRNKAQLVRMGRLGREHVLRYHTFPALAHYILTEAGFSQESIAGKEK